MNLISMNVVTLLYLVASVCFIQALKGLSSPSSARMGNAFGMTGMGIAVITTIALMFKLKEQIQGAAWGLDSCCWASWSAAASVRSRRSASR